MPDISENTTVRLSVIGFLIMAFIGVMGFGIGSIWFASSMSTKLDQIAEEVKAIRVLDVRVYDHETRIKLLESKVDCKIK